MAAGQIKAPIIIPLKLSHLTKTKVLNTDTKIEIISESTDTDIYFTVNGFKPEPFKTIGDKHTFKFSIPFCLPAGKRTVKAMAVSKDGSRESNIVTKVFEIEHGENANYSPKILQQDIYGFLEDIKNKNNSNDLYYQDTKTTNEKDNSTGIQNPNLRSITPQHLPARSSSNKKYGKMPDYNAGLNIETNMETNKVPKRKSELDDIISTKLLTDSSYSSLRLQRETDFLKCIYCLAPRPSDPFSKFCNNCGQSIAPLPQTRLPPPENGQLGMCIQCRSTVPMNLPNCLVCEALLNVQNQPQGTNKLRDRVLCTICGTTNPPHMDSCLTCEAKLPESGKSIKMIEPIRPPAPTMTSSVSPDIIFANCMKCNRQNNVDARFCDWCGYKVSIETSSYPFNGCLTCLRCGANNHHNATYCCQCGNTIIAPAKQKITFPNDSQWNSISIPLSNKNGILKPDTLSTQNGSIFIRQKVPCDVSTQTVGLFYPSTAQLKKNIEKDKPLTTNNIWDKIIPSNYVSPGKGYWRKQIEHIISHLKAHASNSSEFQAMIGEPRIGKLITADVQEEETELTLNLVFSLKGYKDPYVRKNSEEFDKRYLSSMLKRTGSFDSFRSDDTLQSNELPKPQKTPTTSSRCRTAKRKPSNKKQPKSLPDFVLSEVDTSLLKELSASGDGRITEIERLFEEGANPNGKNGKGVPFIIVATRNNHKDAIRLLHELGANVNEIEPEFGNTALHEAVSLGSLNPDIISELLDCGSSVKIKNKKGESPNELALKKNNEIAVQLISKKLGRKQIEKLTKPKQVDDSDDEKI